MRRPDSSGTVEVFGVLAVLVGCGLLVFAAWLIHLVAAVALAGVLLVLAGVILVRVAAAREGES